ncbi:hypothetical protein V8C37DRAFT_261810 [Trichoderma ceciliae]
MDHRRGGFERGHITTLQQFLYWLDRLDGCLNGLRMRYDFFPPFSTAREIKRINPKKKNYSVGILRLAHPTHALRDRNPARHVTGESPLQSETSLKCHLHCLGPTKPTSQVACASGRPPRRSGWASNGGDLTGVGVE